MDKWGVTVAHVAHCQQRGPRGAGFVWHTLLSCEDVLEVFPHLIVEDHVEEEDEDSLWRKKQKRRVQKSGADNGDRQI